LVNVGHVVIYRDVMVPMRDGVRLATDIYLPSDDGERPANGPFAVLLARTPYNKQQGAQQQVAWWATSPGVRGALRGFAVAIQDTRGRYRSQGEFRSMQDDGRDGWDTLDWLGRQSWCVGRVGTFGVSYLGAVQMMLAPLHPPELVSAFSEQPSSDEFTDRTYHAGALTLENVQGWALRTSGEQYNERLPEAVRDRAEQELAEVRQLGPKVFQVLPLQDVPWLRLIRGIWQDVLDAVEDPTFFAANDIRSKVHDVAVPIYHLGGWFDPFLRNTIDHYKGASAVTAHQRLIVGPWTHGGMTRSAAGDTTFPDSAFDDFGYALAWHERWLLAAPAVPAQEHAVILYVMGANRWRAEEAWPLPGTRQASYYLRADGLLSPEAPRTSEPPDRYRYDPHAPMPSPEMGRNAVSALLRRDDVLVYVTPALHESIEITGEISATLFAASSATDTDWMLRLVDIPPDGEAFHIVDGVMRARYRTSRTSPSPLAPGVVERYEVNLWATSLQLSRGHRLGLVISSSNFPKYDRHPNVYADLSQTTERDFVAATQTVHHTPEWPSAIHLPIIEMAEHQRWIANPMPYSELIAGMPAPRELFADGV
jgi:putative CocE/NonD family hydrolase